MTSMRNNKLHAGRSSDFCYRSSNSEFTTFNIFVKKNTKNVKKFFCVKKKI